MSTHNTFSLSAPLRWSNVLFDLDGTLTDPKPGITGCIIHSLQKMGLEAPAMDELLWCIGPPLHSSFARLLNTDHPETIAQAIAFYRERFGDVGLFENAIFPGIAEMLENVLPGRRLFVATSKPWVYAERIIEHFGLSRYFEKIYGSELSGERTDKAELIGYLLTQEGLRAEDTVMVGDREHDVRGARMNGLASIGVLWGYGPVEELRVAGADSIVTTRDELSGLLTSTARAG